MMKKLLYLIPCLILTMTMASCDWFVLDNMDDYDATIKGAFIDSATGDPVPTAVHSTVRGGQFSAFELGWDVEAAQTWYYKNDGTYVNNLVFAGEYRFEALEANFFPFKSDTVTINKGANEQNFTVTPYARVLDPVVTVADSTITATFAVQAGVSGSASATSFTGRLCCYTDRFVCDGFNNVKTDAGAYKASVAADGSTITLTINMRAVANKAVQFKYQRTHYVRIAVKGSGPGINANGRFNYSPVFAISGTTVTEVTDW